MKPQFYLVDADGMGYAKTNDQRCVEAWMLAGWRMVTHEQYEETKRKAWKLYMRNSLSGGDA